jgi:MFS superfamily sulfate permease-like transporter
MLMLMGLTGLGSAVKFIPRPVREISAGFNGIGLEMAAEMKRMTI